MKLSKLFEALVEPKFKNINTKKQFQGYYSGQNYSDGNDNSNAEFLGAGNFAKVYTKKNDPHLVVKVSNPMAEEKLKTDGYYNYIKRIQNTENIFFPKVYDCRVIKNTDQNYVQYVVQIEKLTPLDDLNKKQLENICLMISQENPPAPSVLGINSFIFDTVRGKVDELPEDINQDLLYALNVLKALHADDAGGSNNMCRLTPYGAQLVFADPLYRYKGKPQI